MIKQCTVDYCDRKSAGLGLCDKHYKRYKKHGDPLASYSKSSKPFYTNFISTRKDDIEVLRENFSDLYEARDRKICV